MSELERAPDYTVMCLRLAAEAAADVPTGELRTRFLRMATMWTELAAERHVLH